MKATPFLLATAAVWALVCAATAEPAPERQLGADGLTFLGGEGADPFRLVALSACGQPRMPRGGDLYWTTLDLTPAQDDLYGVLWDELYRIDPTDGSAESLGQIGWGVGDRSWFSGPATVGTTALDGALVYAFYLRATVSFEDEDFALTYEETLEATDFFLLPLPEIVIVDELVEHVPADGVLRSVRLVVTLHSDGSADLDLIDLQGPDAAFVRGLFTALTPGATDGQPIPLPVSGLTFSPEGDLIALSDAEWDPFGRASLYQLDPDVDEVVATWLNEIEAEDIRTIEFADDDTLYAAGEGLYTLDTGSGVATLIADLEPARIVDLDFAPDGRLYGISLDTNGAPALYDFTAEGDWPPPVIYLSGGPVWGLAVLPSDVADIDGDGDADADDRAIFDAEYTGSLSQAHVPPGVTGPDWPDPLPVPVISTEEGYDLDYRSDAAEYSINALDRVFPGIVVDGSTTGLEDVSATLALGHGDGLLFVKVYVTDDEVRDGDDPMTYDRVELYLDSNNSDLPQREGNEFGFQAWISPGLAIGDPGAADAWDRADWSYYPDGFRVAFVVYEVETGMTTGGTYGFDLAILDVDESDFTHVFLYSVDTNGIEDESQWGDIYLAPGPLPGAAADPSPASWSVLIDANTNLGWTSPPEAATHYVYLGSDPDQLVFQGEQTATTFDPGPLSKGWTYYWRIDEVNTNGIRTGTTWAFTTAHSPADIDRDGDVDDFDLRRLEQRPAGDLNGDGWVTIDDYLLFQTALGSSVGDPQYTAAADYDDDGSVDEADGDIWQCHREAFHWMYLGDLDYDGDVDLDDFSIFISCRTGPVRPQVIWSCEDADLNLDDHVDLADFAEFQLVFDGG
jgi:hypothetical protein